jgi:hypothetical protein
MKYTFILGTAAAVTLKHREYPQPDIRGPMPRNAHPDSTFSSHLHNDWTYVQEYPQPDIRGPMPRNAHPDSTFSSHLHNDWTYVQEYPQPDIRGPMPRNAHPDSTFSSHLHNDWTYLQANEYPQPDIRGPMPRNAHPDSTFSSHLHNDWTYLQLDKFEHFTPQFDEAETDGGYKRLVPEQYTEERDDRLMNSLIKNYALEMKDDNGRPSGHMFLNKDAARKVSNEVVHTHFQYNDAQSAAYLNEHFDETWTHFDVNNDGLVEVERMPQFLRWFLGNSLTIGLQ